MEEKTEKDHPADWLKDMPLQSKSEGFEPAEMIACQKCRRNNPPTRLDCLYCGAELEFDETQSQFLKPVLRKAEPHIAGYNLIYLGNLESWEDRQITEVAKMTRLANADLESLFENRTALPLARTETEKELQIVAQRLAEIGIKTLLMADEKFEMDKIPTRLRGLKFAPESLRLKLFNRDEQFELKRDEISLIVVGGVFEKQLETVEKRKKKGESKMLETSELSSDEIVIDIYPTDEMNSFRIFPKGFDFSCLGADKKMFATENIKILINKLREFAGQAQFNDNYSRVRENLSQVWEVEETNDSRGMKRRGFGSFSRQTVTITSNLNQFTKYSRLQKYLLNLSAREEK